MAISQAFLDFVLEQLQPLGAVTCRRMFGGAGLYSDGVFFAVLDDDALYFKTDEATRPRYQAAGCERFDPMPGREAPSFTYFSVPAEVVEHSETLAEWAREAVAAAGRKPARKPRRKPS